MRISLLETAQIDQYLKRQGDPGEYLLLEAQMELNDTLADRVYFQNKTYQLIEEYGRRKLREEICLIEKKVFQDQKHLSFRNKILSYFK